MVTYTTQNHALPLVCFILVFVVGVFFNIYTVKPLFRIFYLTNQDLIPFGAVFSLKLKPYLNPLDQQMTKAKCLEVSVIRQSFCLYVISLHPSLRLLFLISILKIPAKHKDNSKETPNKITHNTLFSFLSLFMPKFEYLVLLFILLFGLLGCFVFFFVSNFQGIYRRGELLNHVFLIQTQASG